MSRLLQTVRLTSRNHYGRKAPRRPLEKCCLLPVAVRQSIRMGVAGAKHHQRPRAGMAASRV